MTLSSISFHFLSPFGSVTVVVSPTSLTSFRITERIYISTRVTHTAITSLTIAQQYINFYYLYRACGQLRPSKESFYRFLFSTGVSKNKNKKGGNIFFFKWWTQLLNRLEKLQRGGDK